MTGSRCALAVIAVVVAIASLGACAQSKPEHVNPLRTPSRIQDVTGIWRSPQQSTLELRAKGTYVLITRVSDALAGEYALSQDRITFFDDRGCGGAQGSYRIQVAVEQRLVFTEPNDVCAQRRNALTADPFVYG